MHSDQLIVASLAEPADWSLEEVAALLACDLEWLQSRWAEGLLCGPQTPPEATRISQATLLRVLRMRRCERDFEASPELAALVADLFEEIDALRARLTRL